MKVDRDELREYVFKYLYLPAIENMYKKGRYWFNSSRPAAYMLENMFEEVGEKVILCNLPPRWEFVIYLVDSDNTVDELTKIALQRHNMLENGTLPQSLPT